MTCNSSWAPRSVSAPSRSAVPDSAPPFVLVDQITTLGTNAWASPTPPRTAVSQQRAATPRMVAQAGYSALVPTPAGMPTRASIQEQLPEGAILVDDDWGVVGNEAIADPAFSGQMMPGEMMDIEMMPGEMMPGEMMPGEMMPGPMVAMARTGRPVGRRARMAWLANFLSVRSVAYSRLPAGLPAGCGFAASTWPGGRAACRRLRW